MLQFDVFTCVNAIGLAAKFVVRWGMASYGKKQWQHVCAQRGVRTPAASLDGNLLSQGLRTSQQKATASSQDAEMVLCARVPKVVSQVLEVEAPGRERFCSRGAAHGTCEAD